jgi:short-subunit dehydrogenase
MSGPSKPVGFALITGASNGIGMELAHLMAQRGHDLLLVARSADRLATLAGGLQREHGVTVRHLALDLAAPGAAQTLHSYCQTEGLPVRILVNNAGYGDYKRVANADAKVLADMLQLNVVALTELSCLFAADFKRQGYGRIGNIGSTSAFQPCPGFASYGASKGYVMLFTEALHAELRGSGVSATVINPGFTDTGFNARADMVGHSMTKGAAEAKDVAQAVYAAMMAGEMNRVVGFVNKLWAQSTLFAASRHLLVWVAQWRLRDRSKPKANSAAW